MGMALHNLPLVVAHDFSKGFYPGITATGLTWESALTHSNCEIQATSAEARFKAYKTGTNVRRQSIELLAIASGVGYFGIFGAGAFYVFLLV